MKKNYVFLVSVIFANIITLKSYSQENSTDVNKHRHEVNIVIDNIFQKM